MTETLDLGTLPPDQTETKQHAPVQHPYVNRGDGNAKDLWALLEKSKNIREAILNLAPEYFEKTERELLQELGPKADQTLLRLKVSFWEEYRHAFRQNRPMLIQNIIAGVCHNMTLQKAIKDPLKLAYLICPPPQEIHVQKQIINVGLQKLLEAVQLPFWKETYSYEYNKHGKKVVTHSIKVDTTLLREIHSIVRTMQDRVHGAVIQRAQIQSKNMNVNVQKATPENLEGEVDLDTLDMDQLESIEKRVSGLLTTVEKALPPGKKHNAKVVEVEVSSDEYEVEQDKSSKRWGGNE
jgi:hypothetical protein